MKSLLVLAAALALAPGLSRADEEERPEAPSADAVPAIEWAKDLAAARTAAAARKVRILAVVTAEFYPSEPGRKLAKALEDPAAAKAAEPFVALRVREKEDLAFSKSLGTEALGHPYTALMDAAGSLIATLRGAREPAEWARCVARLALAADERERWSAEAARNPGDARALWNLSEVLRDLGRVREADETLSRAEKAATAADGGLPALFAYRRLEARVEDRIALQDFEGARALLDGYDRTFPSSPRRRWVSFLRAVTRAYRGEAEAALEDFRELAATEGDPELCAFAKERVSALERVLAARK